MHHGFFEVLDKFQGNFTLSLCLHTLPPHHTRSVTSLPLSIFYRKTEKDLSLAGNTPSSTLHLLKETAGSIPLGNQWCVTPETPLEQPDPAPFHCCAAPVVGQLPCFTYEHIRPVECTGHRVCFKHCWPGLQAGPKLSPGEVWGVAPHLPANWGLLCLSAFLIHSANLPGNCIPLSRWLQAVWMVIAVKEARSKEWD